MQSPQIMKDKYTLLLDNTIKIRPINFKHDDRSRINKSNLYG